MNAVEFQGVTKRFGRTVALDGVTTEIPRGSITGLIGRNGCGKTTLLRHASGLLVADAGECVTLGVPAPLLDGPEMARIGVVHQHDPLLPFMRVGQLVNYVASFYPTWDRELERALGDQLELDRRDGVGSLSPGNRQRLGLVLALCHHPELLLLDEPLSDLDPTARGQVMALLLERFTDDDLTIVISSHLLSDLEPVVNRVLCMDQGRITADEELDTLKERYDEWVVTAGSGPDGGPRSGPDSGSGSADLPERFTEPFVTSGKYEGRRAVLLVEDAGRAEEAAFAARHGVTVERRPLNLDRLFPVLTGGRGSE